MANDDIVQFIGDWTGQVVATSIHAGHELRPEIAGAMVLDEASGCARRTRTPTASPTACATASCHRSRFEVDLNRPRREAVYRDPEDCWGLDVWRAALAGGAGRAVPGDVRRVLRRSWARRLDAVAAAARSSCSTSTPTTTAATGPTPRRRRRRRTPRSTSGTGPLDRDRWAHLVDRFMDELRRPRGSRPPLDVRENVAVPRAATWRGGCTSATPGRAARWRMEFKKIVHGRVDRRASTTTHLDAAHATRSLRRVAACCSSELACRRPMTADARSSPATSPSTTSSRTSRRASGSCSTSRRSTCRGARGVPRRRRPSAGVRATATLEDDPAVAASALAAIDVDGVEDPTLGHLLLAKQRELELQLEMLRVPRDSDEFLALSIELYGAVGAALLARGRAHPRAVPPPGPEAGPWLDADGVRSRPRRGRARPLPRRRDPDLRVARRGAGGQHRRHGVQRRRARRADRPACPTVARRGAAAPRDRHARRHPRQRRRTNHCACSRRPGRLRRDPGGLAVLAEHLVGGLTARRLRQLAARVVAVHRMIGGAPFAEVHDALVDDGVPARAGLHDHDAGVPVGRPHEGRRLPAWAARAASTTCAPAATSTRSGSARCRSRGRRSSTSCTSRGVLRDPLAAAALPR